MSITSDMTPPLERSNSTEVSQSLISTSGNCLFLKLVRKVYNAVKALFFTLKNIIFPPKFRQLSSRDIEFSQNPRHSRRLSRQAPTETPNDLKDRSVTHHGAPSMHSGSDVYPDQKNVLDDPVYHNFYNAGNRLLHDTFEVVFEELIVSEISKIKNQISNIQDYLIEGVDAAVSLGSKLTGPLDEKLANFIPTDVVQEDMKQLLEWLIDPTSSTELFEINEISEQVYAKLKEKIDDGELNGAIGICTEWFFETDHHEPLLRSGIPFQEQSILKLVYQEFIIVLSEHKIREFNAKIQEKLNGNLEGILRQMLVGNGEKLGKIVLERLIRVIDQMPFPEMMDEILLLMVNHTSAIIQAEEAKREIIDKVNQIDDDHYKSQVRELWIETHAQQARANAISNAKERLKNPGEIQAIHLLGPEEWLNNLGEQAKNASVNELNQFYDAIYASNDEGKIREFEEELRKLWVKDIGDKEASKDYKTFRVNDERLCHPHIDELDLVEADATIKSRPDPGNFDLGVIIDQLVEIYQVISNQDTIQQETLFEDVANQLFTLLFHGDAVQINEDSNKIESVDGIASFFNQLEYPQELKDLYKEADFIYSHVLTDKRQKNILNILNTYSRNIETCLLRYAEHLIKKGIAKGISTLFQTVLVPEKIDHSMASFLLPNIQLSIAESIIENVFHSRLKHSFANTYAAIRKNSAKGWDQLKKELADAVKLEMVSSEMDADKIKPLVSTHIDRLIALTTTFLCRLDSVPESDADLQALIVKVLDDHFNGPSPEANPLYGELALNLAFKMGKFSGAAEAFSEFFIERLAGKMTAYAHDWHQSPHFLLNVMTNSINSALADKDQVWEMIFGDPLEIDKNLTLAQLDDELTKTAKIAHDYFTFIINDLHLSVVEESPATGWFGKRWLGKAKNIIGKTINSTATGFTKKSIKQFLGQDHSYLDQAIKRIYGQFFGNPVYIQNLTVRVQEILVKALKKGAETVDSSQATIPRMDHVPTLISSLISSLSE